MRDVRIEPKEEGKGRTFSATLLAAVTADALWEGGQSNTDNMRPVWAMFTASEAEMRPFQANLVLGRKVLFGERQTYHRSDKMELLKSAGYQYTHQRFTEGTVLTAHLPDLFCLDPGMVDPTGARFIVLPPKSWIASERVNDTAAIVQHALKLEYPLDAAALEELVPVAFLFTAYLDRRIRAPIVTDPRFPLQLMLACLSEGLATWPSDSYRGAWQNQQFGVSGRHQFHVYDTDQVGLGQGIAFLAKHDEIETVLSKEVERFFSLIG